MDKFIKKFNKGTRYVNIVSAVGDNELTDASEVSNDYLNEKCIKFIPASGAATRMFKDLYEYMDSKVDTDFTHKFFDNLEQFAFYGDIKEIIVSEGMDREDINGRCQIINMILDEKLDYGNLPKALIKMHLYEDFVATPIDEHIYEGEEYLNKDNINITYSFQKEETDTLAVDMNNKPFLLEDGEALYRAGGHGALIENLNDLDGDIIFIKNIDNVCHRSHIEDTINSKKKLASVFVEVPISTFNPVKTVNDLLRDGHRGREDRI